MTRSTRPAWTKPLRRSTRSRRASAHSTTCLHGAKCRKLPPGSCTVGKRFSIDDVLAGEVLSIWQHAKTVTGVQQCHAAGIKFKVVRVIAGPPDLDAAAAEEAEVEVRDETSQQRAHCMRRAIRFQETWRLGPARNM